MSVENLWGELDVSGTVKAPVTILREQASILGELTNNVLEGLVRQIGPSSATFNYELRVRAPALNAYEVMIADVYHPLELYPLRVRDTLNDRNFECVDEEVFKFALKDILQSESVRRVITALLSQSRAVAQ